MNSGWRSLGGAGTVGLEIVIAIVGGLLLGRWADARWGTAPYLTVTGVLIGLAAAGKAVFRSWRDMQRETEREEREQGNPAPLFDDPGDVESRTKDALNDLASQAPPSLSSPPSSPSPSPLPPKSSNEQQ